MKLTVFLFLWAGSLAAQELDQGKPYIDKALAALGGDSFLHMQNRVETGRVYSFFHEQLSGLAIATIYTEYLNEKPAHGVAVRERQAFGKHKEEYAVLFFPDQGWDLTFRGARPVPEENWQKYQTTTETNFFYFLRERYNEPGLQYDYIGHDLLLNSEVDVVEITDAAQRKIRVYLDHLTHLPVRQMYSSIDPETKYRNDEVTDFSKYRDAGRGVILPFSVHRERNGYRTYELFADRIEVNESLPDKTFTLPPGVKVLKRIE